MDAILCDAVDAIELLIVHPPIAREVVRRRKSFAREPFACSHVADLVGARDGAGFVATALELGDVDLEGLFPGETLRLSHGAYGRDESDTVSAEHRELAPEPSKRPLFPEILRVVVHEAGSDDPRRIAGKREKSRGLHEVRKVRHQTRSRMSGRHLPVASR